MESFPRLRALGCVVCGDPVSPCPSPACPPELFCDLAPLVYRSVLLSSSHPQFTRQELESKLRTGEIERLQTYRLRNRPQDQQGYEHRKQLPVLPEKGSMTLARRYPSFQKNSPGFFSNLQHLQRRLVSGHSSWSRTISQQDEKKSSKPSSRVRCETSQDTKPSNTVTYGLFPPLLDVWAQHDAMQRSITLRI